VRLAGLAIGMRVLEPSAGTGRLLEALPGMVPFGQVRQTALHVVAVQLNPTPAARLHRHLLEFEGRSYRLKQGGARMASGQVKRSIIRRSFEQFVWPEVVQSVVANEEFR
jgi:hypothetical protein